MKNSIQISVVIPTKNREDMLIRAISSYEKNMNQYTELIVVDDNELDCKISNNIINNINKYGKYIRNINSTGVSSARNIGLNKASGTWILFLDDDDELHTSSIQSYLEMISNVKKDIVAISGISKIIKYDKKNNVIKERTDTWANNLSGKGIAKTRLFYDPNCRIIFSGLLVKRNIAMKTLFDETIYSAVDREFLIRLFEYGDLLSMNKLVIVVHTHQMDKINKYSIHKINTYIKI